MSRDGGTSAVRCVVCGRGWEFLPEPAFESDRGLARGLVIDSAGRGTPKAFPCLGGVRPLPPKPCCCRTLLHPGRSPEAVGGRRGWWGDNTAGVGGGHNARVGGGSSVSSACRNFVRVEKGEVGSGSVGKPWMVLCPPQVCHPSDEAYSEGTRPRHLHQTAGGGEGEEGQLRPRGEALAALECPLRRLAVLPRGVFSSSGPQSSLKQNLSQEELRRVWVKED